MKAYLAALAELFKLATMYSDRKATANLAKLLELSMEPIAALAHWNSCKGDMYGIADSLVVQDVSEFLEERIKQ